MVRPIIKWLTDRGASQYDIRALLNSMAALRDGKKLCIPSSPALKFPRSSEEARVMFQTVSRRPHSSVIARCLANRLTHSDDSKRIAVRGQVSLNWTGRIKSALTKFAAAGVLSLCSAVSALAGSYTQPGSTIGPPQGAPIPPGLLFSDWITEGCRTSPSRLCLGDNISVLVWSTPWKIAEARVQLIVAPVVPVWYSIHNVASSSGLYDPFAAAQFAWDLGQGWGASYLLGYYFAAVGGPIASSSDSVNQRFALSYTANGWNLTTNNIFGIVNHSRTNHPHGSPCPTLPSKGCNTDFYNNDITATKTFSNWDLGPVAYYSTDLNKPIRGYQKQSQFALGFLVGYHFGPAVLQIYLTRVVYQKNYGGYDTRLWASIQVKIW